MYEFYLRNLPGNTIRTQARPIQRPTQDDNAIERLHRLPWKSKHKVNNFAKRNNWSDYEKELARGQHLSDYFNMKNNLRYQLKAVAPRYTLIIDLFFPGRFVYLLAINVNTRKAFGLSPTAPFNAPASIYIPNSINTETTVKSVIVHSQAELDDSLSKFPLIAFKAALNMKNKFVMPTSAISNLGLFDTNFDIWAHGDMRVFPDALKPLRNFVFHGMTSNNHFNLVLTYLVPGCEPEFVTSLRTNIEKFLTSLPDVIDETILQ